MAVSTCLAAYVLITALGLLLNFAAIIIILKGKAFGKSIKIQLINIAIADFLGACMVPAFSISTNCLDISYIDSDALCKLHNYLTFTIFYASLLGNTIISIERFVFVYFPLRILSYHKKHTIIAILTSWVIAAVLSIDLIVNSAVIYDIPTEGWILCKLGAVKHALLVPCLLAKFCIPAFVIMVAYVFVGVKLRRESKVGRSPNKRSSNKVIVMLAVDAMISVVTWTSYLIWMLLDSLPKDIKPKYVSTYTVTMIFTVVPLINCFITPVIYLCFNRHFRRDGVDICCGVLTKMKLVRSLDEPVPQADNSGQTIATLGRTMKK